MGDFIHLFETNYDFQDHVSMNYREPFVSYTVEENRVDYNLNNYSFSLFEKIFCDNVNENDIEVFKSNVVGFNYSVYEWRSSYYGQIQFTAGVNEGEHYSQPALICSQSVELTEQQYNEISGMTDEEKLNALLPLLECQGDANHQWSRPQPPQ